jgi:hypothetical protein
MPALAGYLFIAMCVGQQQAMPIPNIGDETALVRLKTDASRFERTEFTIAGGVRTGCGR